MASDEALVTKLRGRFGDFLDAAQLDEILEEPDTDGELNQIRKILGQATESFDDVGAAERVIEKWFRMKSRELLHFLGEKERRFYETYLVSGEMIELRRFLQLLQRGERAEQLPFVFHCVYTERLHLPLDESITIEEYLATLSDLPYFRVLEPFLASGVSAETMDLNVLNINMDRWYFHQLLRETRAMNRSTARELKDLIGMRIDLRNIQWIYHVKQFEPSQNDYLPVQMVEGGKYVIGETLQRLIGNDLSALVDWLRTSHYKALPEQDGTEMPYMPITIQRILFDHCRHVFRRTTNGLVATICFTIMLSARVAEVRRVLEAKNLGMSKEQILPYLVEKTHQ